MGEEGSENVRTVQGPRIWLVGTSRISQRGFVRLLGRQILLLDHLFGG